MKVPCEELSLRTEPAMPNFEEPRCFVFGSEEAVLRVYGSRTLHPAVDFNQSLLIAVHRGVARSGGYGVEVIGAEADGSQVTLQVRRTDPLPGAFVTMALTYPRRHVLLNRSDLAGDGPWIFCFADEKGHVFATVHEQV